MKIKMIITRNGRLPSLSSVQNDMKKCFAFFHSSDKSDDIGAELRYSAKSCRFGVNAYESWRARGTQPKPKWDFGWAQPNFVRLVAQPMGFQLRAQRAASVGGA